MTEGINLDKRTLKPINEHRLMAWGVEGKKTFPKGNIGAITNMYVATKMKLYDMIQTELAMDPGTKLR